MRQAGHMALIGYTRVSTDDQISDLQEDALIQAGCERIFSETISGASQDRPVLTDLLSYLRRGDTLVLWRLDRLGRSLSHLISLVQNLEERGIALRSLTESIDTSTPNGKLVFHLFGSLAQYEREIIRQRVAAGLDAAKRRGRVGGRPKVVTESKAQAISAMIKQGAAAKEICLALSISRATLYRHKSRD